MEHGTGNMQVSTQYIIRLCNHYNFFKGRLGLGYMCILADAMLVVRLLGSYLHSHNHMISLLLILILGFALDLCNNKDIVLIHPGL